MIVIMARVQVINETTLDANTPPTDWTLWFQWCRYLYNGGEMEYGSASITVAALIERWSSHSLTVCRESRDGLPGGAYEFWTRSRSPVNG